MENTCRAGLAGGGIIALDGGSQYTSRRIRHDGAFSHGQRRPPWLQLRILRGGLFEPACSCGPFAPDQPVLNPRSPSSHRKLQYVRRRALRGFRRHVGKVAGWHRGTAFPPSSASRGGSCGAGALSSRPSVIVLMCPQPLPLGMEYPRDTDTGKREAHCFIRICDTLQPTVDERRVRPVPSSTLRRTPARTVYPLARGRE